jgi:hypothetical protein
MGENDGQIMGVDGKIWNNDGNMISEQLEHQNTSKTYNGVCYSDVQKRRWGHFLSKVMNMSTVTGNFHARCGLPKAYAESCRHQPVTVGHWISGGSLQETIIFPMKHGV